MDEEILRVGILVAFQALGILAGAWIGYRMGRASLQWRVESLEAQLREQCLNVIKQETQDSNPVQEKK